MPSCGLSAYLSVTFVYCILNFFHRPSGSPTILVFFKVRNGTRCLSVCLQILNSFDISGMDEAMLFKFGWWVEYGRVHHKGEKFPLKGAWSGSRDPLNNFKPPSIFLEWMKLHRLNFADGSTTASPATWIKIFPWKGRGLGHVTL